MKTTGVYCPSIKEDYDIDHVINDCNQKLDNIINSADLGMFLSDQDENKRLIIKAMIDNLISKL